MFCKCRTRAQRRNLSNTVAPGTRSRLLQLQKGREVAPSTGPAWPMPSPQNVISSLPPRQHSLLWKTWSFKGHTLCSLRKVHLCFLPHLSTLPPLPHPPTEPVQMHTAHQVGTSLPSLTLTS